MISSISVSLSVSEGWFVASWLFFSLSLSVLILSKRDFFSHSAIFLLLSSALLICSFSQCWIFSSRNLWHHLLISHLLSFFLLSSIFFLFTSFSSNLLSSSSRRFCLARAILSAAFCFFSLSTSSSFLMISFASIILSSFSLSFAFSPFFTNFSCFIPFPLCFQSSFFILCSSILLSTISSISIFSRCFLGSFSKCSVIFFCTWSFLLSLLNLEASWSLSFFSRFFILSFFLFTFTSSSPSSI